MKLIIGGACQGKLTYAKETYHIIEGWADGRVCGEEELYRCAGVHHFHEYVRRLADTGLRSSGGQPAGLAELERQADEFARRLHERNPDLVVVSDELGYGIVPEEKADRLWRELTGRICTALAERADEVVRVVCGLGIKLKQAVPNREEIPNQREIPNREEIPNQREIPSREEIPNQREIPNREGVLKECGDGRENVAPVQGNAGGLLFPLFVDLSEKEILIVGAGTIARRRLGTLAGFAGRVTVVAPVVHPDIKTLAAKYPVAVFEREFVPDDLQGKDLVLAATDDPELNGKLYRLCRARGIPANNCSDRRMCDFQFPSVVENGGVVIGINASGRDHRLVKETRRNVERALGIKNGKYQDQQRKAWK